MPPDVRVAGRRRRVVVDQVALAPRHAAAAQATPQLLAPAERDEGQRERVAEPQPRRRQGERRGEREHRPARPAPVAVLLGGRHGDVWGDEHRPPRDQHRHVLGAAQLRRELLAVGGGGGGGRGVERRRAEVLCAGGGGAKGDAQEVRERRDDEHGREEIGDDGDDGDVDDRTARRHRAHVAGGEVTDGDGADGQRQADGDRVQPHVADDHQGLGGGEAAARVITRPHGQ